MVGQQEIVLPFDLATRRNRLQLPPLSYVANTPVSIQIPKVGLIAEIGGIVEIIFTTSGGGTFAVKTGRTKTGGVSPYDAITRIRLTNNQANEVYSTSWWGNYLWTRTLIENFDYRNEITAFGTEAGRIWQQTAPAAISTQYTHRCPFVIPVSLSRSLQAGLLLAQNDYTVYNLEVQWGDIATNLLTLAGGGTITINSATVYPYVEFFNVPNDTRSWPDISKVHVIREEIVDITGNGDFVYNMPIGPTYASMIQEFVNNGLGLTSAEMTNISLLYSGSQRPLNLTSRQFAWYNTRELAGQPMPQGVIWHNWKGASGVATVASGRDMIDTSEVTVINPIVTLSGLTISTAYMRAINEQLYDAV